MLSVQQVVVSPRYPGLKIAVLADTLERAVQLGHDLSSNDEYCYMYSPIHHEYELADGVTLKCFGLSDLRSLHGGEYDQVFVFGHMSLPYNLANVLLRNSWVPETFQLQFVN